MKYIYLLIALLICTSAYSADYNIKVLSIEAHANGDQTFTIEIEKDGITKRGERMYNPPIPKTKKEIKSEVEWLWNQENFIIISDTEITEFDGISLDTKPSNSDIDSAATIEDLKTLLKKMTASKKLRSIK